MTSHSIFPRPPAPGALTVLTQNIRFASEDTLPGQSDHWGDRAPVLADLLRGSDADVIGTQEVLWPQIPVLDEALARTHLRLGIGRSGGSRGEHNLLLLRRDRFEVLDWDQFWLSEHPERIGVPGWDADLERIAVWAHVRDRLTGGALLVAVTHLDHRGQQAQREGAALIGRRLLEQAGEDPILLMGDFNAAGGASDPWRELVAAGMVDAHDEATEIIGEDIGTFPDYGESVAGGTRIDWIMTRGLAVDAYAAHDHVIDGKHASDHAAVAAQLRLP